MAISFHAFKLPINQVEDRLRASDYLPGLRAEKLLDLDERLRSYYSAAFRHWPRACPEANGNVRFRPKADTILAVELPNRMRSSIYIVG